MDNIGFLFYNYDENENGIKITSTFASIRRAPYMVLIGILGHTVKKKTLIQ